jgi:hypothetical protein
MAQELAYKEYRIVPMPRGWGWQALIYAPGSNRHLPESPSTRDPVGRTSVLDTARLVVDRLLQSSWASSQRSRSTRGAMSRPWRGIIEELRAAGLEIRRIDAIPIRNPRRWIHRPFRA